MPANRIPRRLLALVLGLALCLLGWSGGSTVSAQTGLVSITTDRADYRPGDTVRICYTVAGPGPVTITDIQADGSSRMLFSAVDDGNGWCFTGSVTPPLGTECLTITATSGPLIGSAQTCFQVVNRFPPPGPCIQIYPPPPGCGVSITTDQAQYRIGASLRVCYTVPAPGPMTITDRLANGTSQVFFQGIDDGTGGCLGGRITPPVGTECLQIEASGASAQACFQVVRGPLVAPGRPCILIYPPPPGCEPG
jgi:hypothetical protein